MCYIECICSRDAFVFDADDFWLVVFFLFWLLLFSSFVFRWICVEMKSAEQKNDMEIDMGNARTLAPLTLHKLLGVG